MASQHEALSEFKTWVASAVHTNITREHVTWEASMIVLPNNQGGLAPAIAVVMAIKGLVIGEMAQTFSILPVFGHSEESAQRFVDEAIESMLEARSQEAQQALTGEAGPGGQTQGLVIP